MKRGRVTLHSLTVSNYLGAGETPVSLEFCGKSAVLCGPNGSGKTTLLSSLEYVRRIRWASVLMKAPNPGSSQSIRVLEWTDSGRPVAANQFHSGSSSPSNTFSIAPVFCAQPGSTVHALISTAIKDDHDPRVKGHSHLAAQRLEKIYESSSEHSPGSKAIRIGLSLRIRSDNKIQIARIDVPGERLFECEDTGNQTAFLSAGSRKRNEGVYEYGRRSQLVEGLFEVPDSLLQRVIYFPSHRRARQGSNTNVAELAGGSGLISWLQSATNPDPKDSESARRHELLQKFQEEFAQFINCGSVALSVQRQATPAETVETTEPSEINISIDGKLRLLSQLGAGIAEALIMLLVAKLSQEWQEPPIDIVLLEEPELHLHPKMQSALLDRLAGYGVQVIASTHSPTVINWFARNGALIFRTHFDKEAGGIWAAPATSHTEQAELIEAIGATPGDLMLADRVLLVEGPNDVPVFQAWLSKAPSQNGQKFVVYPLGGNTVSSPNFPVSDLRELHPKLFVILDSERKAQAKPASQEREKAKSKFDKAEIPCHLTERRATESYFTGAALKSVYQCVAQDLDPFGDPNLAKQGIKQFKKENNGEVARKMKWTDLESTDLGEALERFLTL